MEWRIYNNYLPKCNESDYLSYHRPFIIYPAVPKWFNMQHRLVGWYLLTLTIIVLFDNGIRKLLDEGCFNRECYPLINKTKNVNIILWIEQDLRRLFVCRVIGSRVKACEGYSANCRTSRILEYWWWGIYREDERHVRPL